ncbi:hypothetical protein [Streptomyces sp. NPDC058297]|uniref:hypothetical protein n=1 Tax=Streptomyces sp. NPDC058297 TaxID=3346433 RepID=UPI0036EA1AB1
MEFLFDCGWCGTENVVFAARGGFWNNRFYLDDFDCWWCGGNCDTPAGPWTPAE